MERTAERQRVEHLVLGRPRPKPDLTRPAGMPRQAWKVERRRLIAEGARLAPGIEEAVRRREDYRGAGTPETLEKHAHRQAGAIARLFELGGIDREQLNAAVEIAEAAERIGADVAIRTASLETRIDGSGWRAEPVFIEGLMRVRHEVAYTRWRAAIAGLGPPAAILDMIVGEAVGFSVAARRHGMRHRRARAMLIGALDLWMRLAAEAWREIGPDALAAAHARILG